MHSSFAILALGASLGAAHMEMITPYAIKSQYDPAQVEADKDYSMTSPLLADGSNFPCKGYQNDPSVHTTGTYTAGQDYQLALKGTATHEGGSCQISMSYDNGKTFRVIKSMIGGCPLVSEYDFTVPSYAPNGTALLAWTWENHTGNREFYMNCAQVDVASDVPASAADALTSSSQRRSREKRQQGPFTQWSDLPYIWKANVPTVNDCVTVEGVNYIYPNPGPDVLYGGGESASSPVTPGTCDSPDPAGPTYEAPSGSGTPSSPSSTTTTTKTSSSPTSSPPSQDCAWPGHCQGTTCSVDADCSDPWSCVSGTCN